MQPSDLLLLGGDELFAVSFAQMKCESGEITAGDVGSRGSFAVVAPSPGFESEEILDFETHLLPAGATVTAVHFYLPLDDRTAVATLGVTGSLRDTLDQAQARIAVGVSVDGSVSIPPPVAYVLLVDTTDAGRMLAVALNEARDRGYALLVPSRAGVAVLPPFDPARDESAREARERGVQP